MSFIGIIAAIIRAITTPRFEDANTIPTEKCPVVAVTKPTGAVMFIGMIGTLGLAIATFEPRVTTRLIGRIEKLIVTGEGGRT